MYHDMNVLVKIFERGFLGGYIYHLDKVTSDKVKLSDILKVLITAYAVTWYAVTCNETTCAIFKYFYVSYGVIDAAAFALDDMLHALRISKKMRKFYFLDMNIFYLDKILHFVAGLVARPAPRHMAPRYI